MKTKSREFINMEIQTTNKEAHKSMESYSIQDHECHVLNNIEDHELDKSERPNEVENSPLSKLHAELLYEIFQWLSPEDLKSVVQVSRLWREEGERPGLWTWRLVRVTRENLSTVPEVLATRRMLLVRRLKVQDWESVSGELLEAVVRHRGLRRLDLRGATLTIVNLQPTPL